MLIQPGDAAVLASAMSVNGTGSPPVLDPTPAKVIVFAWSSMSTDDTVDEWKSCPSPRSSESTVLDSSPCPFLHVCVNDMSPLCPRSWNVPWPFESRQPGVGRNGSKLYTVPLKSMRSVY